jgi:tRNA threonylcarbamoyladenosine biosynthesis protein TsaB
MRILAVDTALGLCSALVMDTATDQIIARESLLMDRGHAEALMPLLERVMAHVPEGFSSLERIATTVGPGSFTGLRVGLSAARAIALATSLPIVGITTLSAFAAPYLGDGSDRNVASVIDARHQHVYLQISGSHGRIIVPPCIIPIVEAEALIFSAEARIVGSGASLFAKLADASHSKTICEADQAGPDCEWVARLAAFANPEDARPTPLYLRPPDAIPQQNGRIALQ